MSIVQSLPRGEENVIDESPLTAKACLKCSQEKPLEDFFLSKKGDRYGRQSYCKPCCAAKHREWREANPVREKEQRRRWRRINRKKLMLEDARRRTVMFKLPFSLTADDFEIPEFCPVLGVKLEQNEGRNGPFSASLDRINPSLGYVVGNVQVISLRANIMKSDATADELRKFAAWILKEFPEQ